MTDADPLAVARKAATLEADRARQKAIRAASQPFFTIGILAMGAAVVLGTWGLLVRNADSAVFAVPFCICIGGLAHGVAAMRSARYIRLHPPESSLAAENSGET